MGEEEQTNKQTKKKKNPFSNNSKDNAIPMSVQVMVTGHQSIQQTVQTLKRNGQHNTPLSSVTLEKAKTYRQASMQVNMCTKLQKNKKQPPTKPYSSSASTPLFASPVPSPPLHSVTNKPKSPDMLEQDCIKGGWPVCKNSTGNSNSDSKLLLCLP